MPKWEKLIWRILGGRSDTNIAFNDLRGLLLHFGFEERVRGSHHVFVKDGVEEQINLQEEGGKAKSYQVRQVRRTLSRYGLRGDDEDV
jgi:hypothetical protein